MELNLQLSNMGLLYPTTLCDLTPYVENLIGLPSNSESVSDQWVLTVRTTDGLQKLFIKIFIHSINSVVLERTMGLQYETLVYEQKIAPIMSSCPFFIKYYGTGQNCNINKILDIHEQTPLLFKKRTYTTLQKKIIRNLYFLYIDQKYIANESCNRIQQMFYNQYIIGEEQNIQRPTLLNELTLYERTLHWSTLIKELMNVGFSYIILENIENPTTVSSLQLFTTEPCIVKWPILFQIIYTIFVMSCHSMLMHNDLQLSNIFVIRLDNEQIFKFQVRDTIFNIRTRYMIKIYDFDLSYSPDVGNNRYIPTVSLNNYQYGPQNSYNVFRDVNKILSLLDHIDSFKENCKLIMNKSGDSITKYVEILTLFYNECGWIPEIQNLEREIDTLEHTLEHTLE